MDEAAKSRLAVLCKGHRRTQRPPLKTHRGHKIGESMTSRKALLLVLALSFQHTVSQEEGVSAAALELEDDCASGQEDIEACSLSLRQLRGQTHRADDAPGAQESLHQGDSHASITSPTEKVADSPAQLEQVSSASAGSASAGEKNHAGDKQAPTYNYNYYFGDDDSKPPGVTPTVETSTNSNGGPVYNYNWHFNIGDDDDKDTSEDKKHVQQGNCQTFGCIDSFDMAKLFDSCQCFPGCDQTPLGNVCCSDYQQTCVVQNHQSQTSWDHEYFVMDHTDCTQSTGTRIGWPRQLSREKCKSRCSRMSQCKGFTYFVLTRSCNLLSQLDLKKCRKWPLAGTAEKFSGKKPVPAPAPPPPFMPAWGSSGGAWGSSGDWGASNWGASNWGSGGAMPWAHMWR